MWWLRGLYCRFIAGHDFNRVPNLPEKIYGRWWQCSFCRRCVVEGLDMPAGQPPTHAT